MPLRDESGQASVELVASLPLIAVLLALAWQAVLIGNAAWAASVAARAAARAAALGTDPAAAARSHLPRELERDLRLSTTANDDRVRLSVRVPTLLAGVSLGRVSASSAFRSQEPTTP
jgi:hypothetical protein